MSPEYCFQVAERQCFHFNIVTLKPQISTSYPARKPLQTPRTVRIICYICLAYWLLTSTRGATIDVYVNCTATRQQKESNRPRWNAHVHRFHYIFYCPTTPVQNESMKPRITNGEKFNGIRVFSFISRARSAFAPSHRALNQR